VKGVHDFADARVLVERDGVVNSKVLVGRIFSAGHLRHLLGPFGFRQFADAVAMKQRAVRGLYGRRRGERPNLEPRGAARLGPGPAYPNEHSAKVEAHDRRLGACAQNDGSFHDAHRIIGTVSKPHEERSHPEDFVELVARAKRGKLKLYLGFAAGVGKTFRMLEEAHALRRRGVDVVIGFIETHGRTETDALLQDVEIVPRRREQYRNIVVEEMDLAAILARAPTMVIVDEIPHTNVPGSPNGKRYQDVIELLDAGINVIGAMNIQHLEGLKGLVQRATGVAVREIVPDAFVRQATQIVNVDLSVEDLVDRLNAGKIYAPEGAAHGLRNFFRPEHLAMLRELALREVAESIEKATGRRFSPSSRDPLAPDRGRVMVCMSSYPPHASALLRRGSRLAGRLNTDWFVVYVETPSEAPARIDAEAQRNLHANIELARELGAVVMRIKGTDPVDTILDFARSHGIGLILIGRSSRPWHKQIFGRSVPLRLVREATEFDVQVVTTLEDARKA
jgi:two-component system sensor histidine kinase KdpD